MLRSKVVWFFVMAGALAGWAFIIAGLIRPFENRTVEKIRTQVLIAWVFGHMLELLPAFLIGRSAGLSAGRIVLKTMALGFSWWVPLGLKVIGK